MAQHGGSALYHSSPQLLNTYRYRGVLLSPPVVVAVVVVMILREVTMQMSQRGAQKHEERNPSLSTYPVATLQRAFQHRASNKASPNATVRWWWWLLLLHVHH
jgi:hypothetical protein